MAVISIFVSVFSVVLPSSFSTVFSKHLDAMTALSPSGANAVKQECKNDSDCEVFAVKNVKSLPSPKGRLSQCTAMWVGCYFNL